MKLTAMFWNLNRKPLQDQVARLAREHHIDLLILTELGSSLTEIRSTVTTTVGTEYRVPFSPAKEIGILSSFTRATVRPVYDDPLGHLTIRRIIVEDRIDLLLAAVHLQSKRHWRDDDLLLPASPKR